MKDFFKFMLASMLGFILVIGIIFFISFGLLISVMSFAEKSEVVISENTVIKISLNEPIPERTLKNPFLSDIYSGSFKTVLGLNDIIKNIQFAAEDDQVKGIILDLNIVPSGITTLGEIRAALEAFKETDKFILCYGEYMSQSAYYLGSVADEICLHPEGFIDFKGLNAQVMFIKGALDKLGIDMQIVRHGKYKSAVEPLIQKEMSAENREQYSTFINSIWQSMLAQVSASRGLSVEELNLMADELISYDAKVAAENGLIDQTTYRDEYRQIILDKVNIDNFDDINFITLNQYDRVLKSVDITAQRIAVIYATGSIGSGQGSAEQVGADQFAKTIAKVREDENVKAIVFRVNSPGGDALASDVIWRELALTKEVKPVIISMGDVAASGGYWISCASDRILANPTTLTGSIGVFGVIPNIGDFMDDKLGISYDFAKSNENAGFPSIIRPLTSYERLVLQGRVDDIYQLFLSRVSNNRDMPEEEVDKIGEGRVWSGVDAKRLNLIDDFGGLYDAIDLAAEISGVDAYRILELPIQKDPIEQLLEDLSSGVKTNMLKAELGPFYRDYMQLKSALSWEGVQARLPFQAVIE